MDERVKIFAKKISGEPNSISKETTELEDEANAFFKKTKGRFILLQPFDVGPYGTNLLLIATYVDCGGTSIAVSPES